MDGNTSPVTLAEVTTPWTIQIKPKNPKHKKSTFFALHVIKVGDDSHREWDSYSKSEDTIHNDTKYHVGDMVRVNIIDEESEELREEPAVVAECRGPYVLVVWLYEAEKRKGLLAKEGINVEARGYKLVLTTHADIVPKSTLYAPMSPDEKMRLCTDAVIRFSPREHAIKLQDTRDCYMCKLTKKVGARGPKSFQPPYQGQIPAPDPTSLDTGKQAHSILDDSKPGSNQHRNLVSNEAGTALSHSYRELNQGLRKRQQHGQESFSEDQPVPKKQRGESHEKGDSRCVDLSHRLFGPQGLSRTTSTSGQDSGSGLTPHLKTATSRDKFQDAKDQDQTSPGPSPSTLDVVDSERQVREAALYRHSSNATQEQGAPVKAQAFDDLKGSGSCTPDESDQGVEERLGDNITEQNGVSSNRLSLSETGAGREEDQISSRQAMINNFDEYQPAPLTGTQREAVGHNPGAPLSTVSRDVFPEEELTCVPNFSHSHSSNASTMRIKSGNDCDTNKSNLARAGRHLDDYDDRDWSAFQPDEVATGKSSDTINALRPDDIDDIADVRADADGYTRAEDIDNAPIAAAAESINTDAQMRGSISQKSPSQQIGKGEQLLSLYRQVRQKLLAWPDVHPDALLYLDRSFSAVAATAPDRPRPPHTGKLLILPWLSAFTRSSSRATESPSP